MHLISPSVIEMLLSKHMFDRVRADDWDPVLAMGADRPGLLPFLAAITIDYGYLGGLKSLFDKGLDPNSTVQADWLRNGGYGQRSTVSLVRLVAEMCSPGYRAGDTIAEYFQVFQQKGAKIPREVLDLAIQGDDVQAVRQLLDHAPGLLQDALKSPRVCIASMIYSPGMMEVMLDKGLPVSGDVGVSEWLWSRSDGFASQAAPIVAVLARRGVDLDQPNPDPSHSHQAEKTVLEYLLDPARRKEDGEVPYLLALVEHGARVDRVDLERVPQDRSAVVVAILEKRAQLQAQTLSLSTPQSAHPHRQVRL